MFRQINCHPQEVSIKELQVRTASKYTTGGFRVEVLTQLTSTVKPPGVYLDAVRAYNSLINTPLGW
jgi:hypothetical protein